MNLLLDTHVVLWWLNDDRELSDQLRVVIGSSSNVVAVSAASTWEIAIKRATGKLHVSDVIEHEIATSGFNLLTITVEDSFRAGGLPLYHGDPFDRMLIGQAIDRKLTIVTRDSRFEAYGVDLMRA